MRDAAAGKNGRRLALRRAKGDESAAATAAERYLIDGRRALMESALSSYSTTARLASRNAPSRRAPQPGNQARFICNNPVTGRRRPTASYY